MSEENELPVGWIETTLGEVATINPGVDTSDIPDTTPVSFIPMAAVEAGTGRIDNSAQRKLNEVRKGYTAFQEEDILFAKITPCMENGKAAVAQSLTSKIGFGSTEFHVLRPGAGIDTKLLYYYISQELFRQMARTYMTGSAGQLRVPATFLVDVLYPLAPTNEQHRIVAAIEQQFTRLDAAVEALKQAQKKLKLYRSAILKAAVEGKLTEDWRARHPTTEPAAMLLKRILQERRAKWEADYLAKMAARGVIPKDDKWKEGYKEPAQPDIEGLPVLPEGWCWVRAEQLCDFITKGTTPSVEKLHIGNGEIPFIKVYNLTNSGVLDFSKNPTFISRQTHSQELARSCVFPGDVLMNIVGPPLGKVAIVPNEYLEWNINQAVAIFRPMPSYNRKLLCYSLLEETILSWATRLAKATAGQFNLTLEICRNLPFPLPPLAEQEQIVALVEEQLSIISELETTVEHSLRRAERERQSILREAFAGRLVPQDPEDEPASVLLERIRAERKRREEEERGARKGKGKQGRKMVQEVLLESN